MFERMNERMNIKFKQDLEKLSNMLIPNLISEINTMPYLTQMVEISVS